MQFRLVTIADPHALRLRYVELSATNLETAAMLLEAAPASATGAHP